MQQEIKMNNNINIVLLTGSSNPQLADKIGENLGIKVSNPVSKFVDGEIRIVIGGNLKDKHVFIIQSTSTPVNDHLVELLLMVDAAKRSFAAKITVVIPYFGYARQDRQEQTGTPISASLFIRTLEIAGIDEIITIDIHSEQQKGFASVPWENLYGSTVLAPVVNNFLKDLVIVSPDKGGVQRAIAFSKLLKLEDICVLYKSRDTSKNNHSEVLDIVGAINGKNALIVDDLIDSGGTIINAANLLKQRGAKKIIIAASHGLFSSDALDKIVNSPIDKVFITDTVYQKRTNTNPKIDVVSISSLLADAIRDKA